MDLSQLPTLTNNQRAGRILFGRTVAEVGGFAVFFGCTAFMDQLFPHEVKWLKGFVAEHFTKHHLGAMEKVADKFLPAFEGSEKAQRRQQMTPEEKANYFASYLVDYGIKIPVSYLGLNQIQKAVFPKLGLRKPSETENWIALACDEVPKIGSVIYFNTQIPKDIDRHRQSIAKILQSSTGMSADRADTYATDTLNVVVPNAIGVASSSAYLCYRLLAGKDVSKA